SMAFFQAFCASRTCESVFSLITSCFLTVFRRSSRRIGAVESKPQCPPRQRNCCTATRPSLFAALEGALELGQLAAEILDVAAGRGLRLGRRGRRRRRGLSPAGPPEPAQEEPRQRVGGREGHVGEGVVGRDGLGPLPGLKI